MDINGLHRINFDVQIFDDSSLYLLPKGVSDPFLESYFNSVCHFSV